MKKNLSRKRYTQKVDSEKNEKQSFSIQKMSLFEISLLIYLRFLHYSSGFIESLCVDILCLNCDHDSSYINVTPCRICFINFLFSSGNKITFINFLPIQDTCINFSECSNNENGYCFCKGLEGDLLGDFSILPNYLWM